MPLPPRDPETPSLLHTRFTDRDTHRNLFDAYLNAVTGPFPALMFYGIGGIGKSWLLRHLQLHAKGMGVPSVLIDFTQEAGSNIYRSDPLSILATLRSLTVAPCPQFDIAFTLALVRRNRLDEGALRDKVKTGSISTVWETVKGLVGIAHPAVSVALVALEKGYGFIRDHALLREIEGVFLKDLEDLQTKELSAIESDLIRRLGKDLCREEAFPLRRGFRALQAVVFVDTSEALLPANMSEPDEERASLWLRDLICLLRHRVLFLLAGQNRLDWSFIHSDWKDDAWLEQHQIGGLNETDACDYFRRCGIPDPAVQQAMLSHCSRVDEGYHTASLGLLADIVWLAAREGKPVTPALFHDVRKDDMASLVRRFLKSLPSAADQDWMRVLAVTPSFDERAARTMYSEHKSQAQHTAWEMLTGLSFLVPSATQGEWYSIHSAIQDALARSGQLRPAWHQAWLKYWNSRSEDPRTLEASLGWFHLWHLERGTARQKWNALAEHTRKALNMQLHLALLRWWAATGVAERKAFNEEDGADLASLGVELWQASLGDRAANLRNAIRCYENALQVRARQAFPADWAGTQNNLGLAYSDLPDGDRAANQRNAIRCYENALQVHTREAFPADWAQTQNNLGNAYSDLPDGDRAANLRNAIRCYESALQVRTREAFPADWAMTQSNLGHAYANLPDGDRAANLRNAIRCYENALQVRTREALPADWAMTQNNLGLAYADLPSGDRAANLRNAIRCYGNALQVRTRVAFPAAWAGTQNNLGNAYANLPGGDRAANLRNAIRCYENALLVYTRVAFPAHWAMTQNNLGNAYQILPDDDRAANLRNAIRCYENAQQVRTREALPADWAMTQNNLGLAYANLPDGDRAANLRNAIRCYGNALQVRTLEAFRADWAMTQNNLGLAYADLPDGDRAANLRNAIRCYVDALLVYTRVAFPAHWAMTQNNLGNAYQILPDDDRAANLRNAIRCYENALLVCSREAFPADWETLQKDHRLARELLAKISNS